MVARLIPAVLATFLASLGFAGLKFLLIGEMALDFGRRYPDGPPAMPFAWMDRFLAACLAQGNIKEAITQGLAAAITLGVILGYLINAPLAGAWRTRLLFAASGIGVGLGSVLVLTCNLWLVMVGVGLFYGAACAARGKVVPLLARATGSSATLVMGIVNASMVIGLLAGTVLGIVLFKKIEAEWLRHVLLGLVMLGATISGALLRVPEPRPIPFRRGFADLLGGSVSMMRRHWPLLASGGLAWGIVSAASLAMLLWLVKEVGVPETLAVTLSIFAAVGAVVGNLASHRWDGRKHVVGAFVILSAAILLFPVLVEGYWSGAALATVVGASFAAGANVVDARFMLESAREGQSGRGSTIMSLIHSIFIFFVGLGVAFALFTGVIRDVHQYWILAGASLLAALCALPARLHDKA